MNDVKSPMSPPQPADESLEKIVYRLETLHYDNKDTIKALYTIAKEHSVLLSRIATRLMTITVVVFVGFLALILR